MTSCAVGVAGGTVDVSHALVCRGDQPHRRPHRHTRATVRVPWLCCVVDAPHCHHLSSLEGTNPCEVFPQTPGDGDDAPWDAYWGTILSKPSRAACGPPVA